MRQIADHLGVHYSTVSRSLAKLECWIGRPRGSLRELMNPPEPKKRPIGFVELQEKK